MLESLVALSKVELKNGKVKYFAGSFKNSGSHCGITCQDTGRICYAIRWVNVDRVSTVVMLESEWKAKQEGAM